MRVEQKQLIEQALEALRNQHWSAAQSLASAMANDQELLGEALYVFGMLSWQRADHALALQQLTAAFQNDGPFERCGFALASLLIEELRLAEAEDFLAALLNQMPDSLDLRLVYGELLLKVGKLALASDQVAYLMEMAASSSSSLRLRGDWLMEASRDVVAAKECYQMARVLDAEDMGAVIGLLVIHQMQGEMADAAKLLLQIESSGLRSGRLYRELGDLLLRLNNPAQALSACIKALEIDPEDATTQYVTGEVCMRLNRPVLARIYFSKAINLKPEWLAAHCSMARVGAALGEFDLAMSTLDQLIAVHPNDNYPKLVKGALLNGVGRYEEALEAYQNPVLERPDGPGLVFNRSMLELRLGDFKKGWDDYRMRFRTGMVRRLKLSTPEWTGELLPDQTLLLVWEQGLGDTIQFSRFARMAKARVGRLILSCQPSLEPLVRDIDGVDEVVAIGSDPKDEDIPGHDQHVYLMTLPHVLNIEVQDLPVSFAYLHANAECVDTWRDRLESNGQLRVGLVWAGNPLHTNDARRSLKVEQLLPLSAVEHVKFFSILKGIDVQQLEEIRDQWPIPDLGNTFADFADTAAVVELLDLVIAVDTSVAHLCGAMNKPLWLLLPYVSDWRWMNGREDSPWYPSVRLFQQKQGQDWAEVVSRVQAELKLLANSHLIK